jgi:ribosomal-protein-alanine N-acetyltransferase
VTPTVRAATPADIAAILQIEAECFADQNWVTEDFAQNHCTVAALSERVVGFLVSRETFPGSLSESPEREILNVAVRPAFRRQGIARLLLENELRHPAIFFLEVRESNTAARCLYTTLGFREIGRRENYYQQPIETAIVMQMN